MLVIVAIGSLKGAAAWQAMTAAAARMENFDIEQNMNYLQILVVVENLFSIQTYLSSRNHPRFSVGAKSRASVGAIGIFGWAGNRPARLLLDYWSRARQQAVGRRGLIRSLAANE